MTDHDQPALNTDRELWRAADDYYAPSIHVTQGGGIGMNVGGTVIVMPIEKWHALASEYSKSGERCPRCGSEERDKYKAPCLNGFISPYSSDPWHLKSGDTPDANCKTLPNGDCVAVKCMHSPEATSDLVKCRRCGFVGKADILPEGDAPAGTTPDAPAFYDWAKRHGFGREVPEGDGWSWEFEPSEPARKAYDELLAARASSAPPTDGLRLECRGCGRYGDFDYVARWLPSPPAGQRQ